MERVGFVGLGVMGAPMAGHILRSGWPLTVWNRTPSKMEPLIAQGAQATDTLDDLAANCSIIYLCVNRTEDVDGCLKEILRTAADQTLVVDHSTIEPQAATNFHAELKARNLDFIDAPVTGGSMGAQNGTLTVFCGGEPEPIERARIITESYAKRIERVGGPGSGQMMKMANQIAVAGALLALCESMAFAKKANLNLAQTRELLASGAAGSWAFDNYGPKIVNEDWSPGFSIKNQRKDLNYCLDTAQLLNANLPGSELVNNLLEVLENQGYGEFATPALYKVLLDLGGEV